MALEWERAEEEGRRMADAERLQAKETLLRQQEVIIPFANHPYNPGWTVIKALVHGYWRFTSYRSVAPPVLSF